MAGGSRCRSAPRGGRAFHGSLQPQKRDAPSHGPCGSPAQQRSPAASTRAACFGLVPGRPRRSTAATPFALASITSRSGLRCQHRRAGGGAQRASIRSAGSPPANPGAPVEPHGVLRHVAPLGPGSGKLIEPLGIAGHRHLPRRSASLLRTPKVDLLLPARSGHRRRGGAPFRQNCLRVLCVFNDFSGYSDISCSVHRP